MAAQVWDVETLECLRVLAGHASGVCTLAVCGNWLVSGSNEARPAQPPPHTHTHTHITHMLVGGGPGLFSGSNKARIIPPFRTPTLSHTPSHA